MILAIPEDKEAAFRTDYAAWCLSEGVMDVLTNGTRTDHVVHDPYKTTNTSNPIKASIVVATFQDLSGTLSNFLKAYPRWAQHQE